MSKSSPIKQASLRNSARSLIERRAEPLGNPNKGHTVRTPRGLPFDASYACTSMHEFGSPLFLTNPSQSNHTQRVRQLLTQPGDGPSWAYSPYLPLERESKWGCGTRHKRSKAPMHACVCSSQCYKRGRFVCKSSCHGYPALHRKTGPVVPHDNHSLAKGHQFCPNFTSIHLAIH